MVSARLPALLLIASLWIILAGCTLIPTPVTTTPTQVIGELPTATLSPDITATQSTPTPPTPQTPEGTLPTSSTVTRLPDGGPSSTPQPAITETPAPIPSEIPTPVTPYTTYHIRPDGGSNSQCNGRADAAYPGIGFNQPCAWDHPFRALPPRGSPRILAGDTLLIHYGSYRMGIGAPGANNCLPENSQNCFMAAIPSGPSPDTPTRVIGIGQEGRCSSPPELWGTEQTQRVINLQGSNNVEVACFEITDHLNCADLHTGGLACDRSGYPFGDWAQHGVYASDSSQVTLRDMNIHGLAVSGIQAGRLTNWLVSGVRMAANGWAGWEGNIEGDDSNDGTLAFEMILAEWNGCSETYPGTEPTGCRSGEAGLGDGLNSQETRGHWVFEASTFQYNTSRGLDLSLLADNAVVEIRGALAIGNAGEQIQVAGNTRIENSILVGSCSFFNGQPFNFQVGDCARNGNTLAMQLRRGSKVWLANNSLTGEGACQMSAACDPARGACDGSEGILVRNNLFEGQVIFPSPSARSCLYSSVGFPRFPFDINYNLVHGMQGDFCPAGDHSLCAAPEIENASLNGFNPQPSLASPAIDAGDLQYCPSRDISGQHRPIDGDKNGVLTCDIGAYELWVPASSIYLPMIER